MSKCQINFQLGQPPEGACGQWIEAHVQIEERSGFAFNADFCRLRPRDELSLYRVREYVDAPFTAERVLSLLALAALPPFAPTGHGLDISVKGDASLADGEIARIIEPSVRQSITRSNAEGPWSASLVEKLAQATKLRSLQENFFDPGFI